MRVAVATGLITLVLMGCSMPTETIIPSDVSKWDTDLAPSVQKLPEADRAKVAAFLMRAKVGETLGGNGIPPGTTLGAALAEQKKWEETQAQKRAAEAELKAKLEKDQQSAMAELNKAVTVTLLKKSEVPKDFHSGRYSDYQEFRIGVLNNTEKDLAGVSGEIKFVDVFDKDVGAVNFRISERIRPGQSVTWVGGRDYNQFLDAHKAVWNLEDGKYTTRFVPDAVVFADGTKLSLPK